MEELMIQVLHEKEKLMQQIIDELKETNQLLRGTYRGQNPNELLTAKQIAEEYGIRQQTILDTFKDPNLEVQRWTRPFKVKRRVFEEYLDKNHDYLCK